MKLRILTINVQNDEGDPRRLGLINSELRRLDPDIVAFQEVLRTGECDQLDELLDGTDRHGTHQAQAMAYAPPWADRYGQIRAATVAFDQPTDGVWASDHYGLVVDVDIGTGA